jgi:hypothetical protein
MAQQEPQAMLKRLSARPGRWAQTHELEVRENSRSQQATQWQRPELRVWPESESLNFLPSNLQAQVWPVILSAP